jgi:putative DNA primase/helicase
MADLTKILGSNWMSNAINSTDLADPVRSFTDECLTHGLDVARGVIADGQIHRVPHESSKRGSLDGWYVIHIDGKVPVGRFGCFKEPSFEVEWKANIGRELTFTERMEHTKWVNELRMRLEAEKKQAQADAAERADEEINDLIDASGEHPYLQKKRVKPHGIKINRAGKLVVPIYDPDGKIVSYQTIAADGSKLYLKGGKKDGCFYEIRGNKAVVMIAEGFATAATVNEATGFHTMVAFDAGNLSKVAKAAKALYPGSKIIVAADNDQFTDGNPGVTKANAAASDVRGEVVYPTFAPDEVLSGKPTDWNDLHCLRGLDAVKEQIERVTTPAAKSKGFEWVHIDDIDLTEIKWIIDDYIEEDSLVQVFGDPGGGKSFVAIDMACCIATGTKWHGHEVKQGAVFYIAGEGHNGLARRFKAWELGHGVSTRGAPIFKSKTAAQLYDATSAALVGDTINDLVQQTGCQPSCIVIDTMARNMGGDENSTQDMNAFIQHIDTYLRQPYRCAVMIVHHSGTADKDRGRGSSALKGAIDAEYKVQLDQSTKMIQVEAKKMKEAELPPALNFNLTQVDLPIFDRHGEAVKGAYLQTVDISGLVKQANEKHVFLGKHQNALLKLITEIEASNIKKIEAGDFPVIADWDTLREMARTSKDIERNRFSEAIGALCEKNLITKDSEGVFRIVRNVRKASETDETGQ